MKKAKLILGAVLIAGVAYAAGQNFTVIVNGQVSDLQGVVLNNRLYVPADVLPDLGIRISAAPGVLSLSSDAGGGSRGSMSVTTPSTVVTGGNAMRSRDYSGQAFKNGNLSVALDACRRVIGEGVVCSFNSLNNGNDATWSIYARNQFGTSKLILEDGTEFDAIGAKLSGGTSWDTRPQLLLRSQIKYVIQVKFIVPDYVRGVKYLDFVVGMVQNRINNVEID